MASSDSTSSASLFSPLGALLDPTKGQEGDDDNEETSSSSSYSSPALMNVPNHLPNRVRNTCLEWHTSHMRDVMIQDDALEVLAQEIFEQAAACAGNTTTTANQEMNHITELVEWDEEGWHYNPPRDWPAHIRRERIALYILAMDAINFCFWPPASSNDGDNYDNFYEYEQLATSMAKAAQRDHWQQSQQLDRVVVCNADNDEYFFSATSLRDMTVDRMKQALDVLPPNLEQRCALWKQVGQVLLRDFEGSAWKLIERANGSAVKAVSLLYQHFEGFRDVVLLTNTSKQDTTESTPESVFFLKRAQICVGDWKASLAEYWKVNDLDELTTFADYRLPQLMRERGILIYCQPLAQRVDKRQEIPATSRAEISLRAATVVAVDRLAAWLNRMQQGSDEHDKKWTAVSVDWYLWQLGERLEAAGKLKPHHRVRTIFY